ncbi:hypothetical protein LXA43DRAFT_634949 [Ganoderma leucocontextum]|nr:hypothetical protein LXA43DRAFT_634949 [Ganoderma leucocontextum]
MTVMALIFVVLAFLLASITIWLFFIRSRQHCLLASTTEIEVQIEVEKCQDATPGSAAVPSSRSSILPFPVVATRPPSTPNIRLRALMDRLKRKSSDEAIGVSLPSPPNDDKYTELPPSPRDSQPPIRRECGSPSTPTLLWQPSTMIHWRTAAVSEANFLCLRPRTTPIAFRQCSRQRDSKSGFGLGAPDASCAQPHYPREVSSRPSSYLSGLGAIGLSDRSCLQPFSRWCQGSH